MTKPIGPSRPLENIGLSRGEVGLFAFGFLYVLCHAYIPGFSRMLPVLCYSKNLINLDCPLCGCSRAFGCFLRLDFLKAIEYNPISPFFFVIFSGIFFNKFIQYFFKTDPSEKIPPLMTKIFYGLFFLVFFIIGVVRLITWAFPDLNPRGYLIPPPN